MRQQVNGKNLLGIDPLTLVRENVRAMIAYSSARDEYAENQGIFLDANENPFGNGLNRYPDPAQKSLKGSLAKLKAIPSDQIFLGNGSDEVIDLLFRAFCRPEFDNVVICTPTYGLYRVAADLNAIESREVELDEDFQPNVQKVLENCDERTKMLFLCSPNNPTGNLLDPNRVERLVEQFPGLVIMDEAYVDFAPDASMLADLSSYRNLVVLQTLSKAWGLAGIRLGMGFARPEVVEILHKIKPPYNVNRLTQEKAMEVLSEEGKMRASVQIVVKEREKLQLALENFPFVQKVYPSQANFLLVKVLNARKLYVYLLQKGLVVRDRSKVTGLEECLRISVGTPEENNKLLKALKGYEIEK